MRFRNICAAVLALLIVCGLGGCVFSRETPPDFSGEAVASADGSPVKHYFEQLDNTEKHAYNAILAEVRGFPEKIAVPTLTNDQLNHLYTALLYDNPELFFLDRYSSVRQSKKTSYFYPRYRMGQADYEAMLKKCIDVADKITEEVRQEKSVFDKELAVHDKLIAMCRYSENTAYMYRNTIYGVLCGNNATCEGYARTAKYLLDRLGVPCYVISGQSTPPGSTTSSHMWNIVEVDGKHYHLDLTWDDPVIESGQNLIRHTYFNVSDSVISKTHAGFTGADACTAIDDNYFVHEHLVFADWGAAERQRAVEIAAASIEAGSEGFQLRFSNEATYKKAKQALFESHEVYEILQKVQEETDMPYAADRMSLFEGDDYTIDVILEK